MRTMVVPSLLCMLTAGTLHALDAEPKEAGTPSGGKAGAPASLSANGAADSSGAVDGIAAGATLGLSPVTNEEMPEEQGGKRFTLHIPIKTRPKTPIEVGHVTIHVLFYDLVEGKDVVPTRADVRSHWKKPPADWIDAENKELAVEYHLLPSEPENCKYFGYIVRVYYKGRLQAAVANPKRLEAQFPAPATLEEHASATPAAAGGARQSPAEFAKRARALRESAMLNIEPEVSIPTRARVLAGRYSWKFGIVTTVFYIGSEKKGEQNHDASAWDPNWKESFGGVDNPDPTARKDFLPAGFTPRQNPFYVALPYNDIQGESTKPESAIVIPWFKEAYEAPGKSVCRDRWVEIRSAAGKVCFAQWSDCGPFRTDHFQYVFGNERPKPNLNQGSGLEVSPAVRDYLGLSRTDVTDWKFVTLREVQAGPWRSYGDNNPFVIEERRKAEDSDAPPAPAPGVKGPADENK